MALLQLAFLVSLAAQPSQLEQRALDANAEGNRFAAAGKFPEAIAAFKRAESLIPRFEHHCNIAQAYFVMKRWGQAWLYLDDCRARTPAGSPISGPMMQLMKQVQAQLKAEKFVAVTVESDELVSVAFSELAPDELWRVAGERAFWLPPVAQSMLAETSAQKWSQPLTPSGKSLRVRVERPAPPPEVAKPEVASPDPKPEKTEPEPQKPEPVARVDMTTTQAPLPRPSRAVAGPVILGASGVAVSAFGVAMFFVAKDSQTEASMLEAGPSFDAVKQRFQVERAFTYGSFALGGAMAVAGFAWWLFSGLGPSSPSVVVVPVVGPERAGFALTGTFEECRF